MKSIKWDVKQQLQPTNNTCGYTALSILLSHYGKDYSAIDLVNKVPQPKDDSGKIEGSVTAQLVDWCQQQGMQTHMYVSDPYVLDLSWKDMSSEEIKERLKIVGPTRKVMALGNHWTKVYVEAYITMLENGAKLTITPFITTKLLYELLAKGPVYANIGATANSGNGRTINPGLREKVVDDIKGDVSTHSLVIYGHEENGYFLVADPWDGPVKIEPERMVLAIQAAQIECDNQVFVIKKA